MVGSLVMLKMQQNQKKIRRKKKNSAQCPKTSLVVEVPPVSTPSSSQIFIKIEPIKSEYEDPTLCRVCLKQGEIPIFGLKDLSEDLNTFAGIEVHDQDPYPKNLCLACNSVLESAVLLRKTAQESDHVLKNHEQDVLPNFPPPDVHYADDPMDSSYMEEGNFDTSGPETMKPGRRESTEQKFYCRMCSLYFETKEEYANHKINVEHERITCPICHKDYNSDYFKHHLKLHNDESPCVCEVCGKRFQYPSLCNRHRQMHLQDLPYQCSLCPYRGRFKGYLTLHMRQHTGEKPYKCPHCPSKAFANASNYRKHALTHKTELDFVCDECQRGFKRKQDLEQHVKYQHRGIKDNFCDVCGKAFGYRRQMWKHKLKVHKKEQKPGRMPLYMIVESQKRAEGQNDESEEGNKEPKREHDEPEDENDEPEGENDEPEGENDEPEAENDEPEGENDEPEAENNEPEAENYESPMENYEYAIENDEPGGENDELEGDSEPEGEKDEPYGENSKELKRENQELEEENQEIKID